MPRKTNKQQSAPEVDPVLKATIDRFDDSWDYAKDHWHDKWDRDEKLYDSERYKASYEGVSDTFVPMVFPTIETMTAALAMASLRFDYTPSNPMTKATAAPLNGLVDGWWEEESWDIAMEEGSREFIKKGMAAYMWSWDIDRPYLDWFSMRDAIVDPTIKRPGQLQQPGAYAGRRYFVRKGALDDYEVVDTDPESKTYGQMVKRYNMPASDSSAPKKDDDKGEKDMMSGSTLKDAADKQDEIIEIWDVDKVVTVVNRMAVIENVENPYKARHRQVLEQKYMAEAEAAAAAVDPVTQEPIAVDPEAIATAQQGAKNRAVAEARGVVPFFFFRNYRDISLFYAKSEIDSIAKEQERLNDLTNMETDSIMKQNAQQKELDPAYEDWLDLIDDDPGTVYPFPAGTLNPIPPAPVPQNSWQNRLDAKNDIREATGIDQVAKGGSSAPGTTATEIVKQEQSTGQRIESKARILEKDGLYWMAWILFKVIQLNVTEPQVVSVSGASADIGSGPQTLPNGDPLPAGVAIFDPANYQDDWRPSISLEIDAKSKQQKERQSAREEYQILIQDPTNNLQEVKKRYYPKIFDIDKQDLDAIMTPAAGQGLAGADPAMVAAAGQPPVEQPVPQEGA